MVTPIVAAVENLLTILPLRSAKSCLVPTTTRTRLAASLRLEASARRSTRGTSKASSIPSPSSSSPSRASHRKFAADLTLTSSLPYSDFKESVVIVELYPKRKAHHSSERDHAFIGTNDRVRFLSRRSLPID